MRRSALAVGLLLMAGVQSQAQDDFCAGIAVLTTLRFEDRFAFLMDLVDVGTDKPGVLDAAARPVKSVLRGYGERVVEFEKLGGSVSDKVAFPIGYRYTCRREQTVSPRMAQEAVRRCLDANWKSRLPLETRITFNRPASYNPYKNPGCRGMEITVGGQDGRYVAFEDNWFWCIARVSRRK
jgi:hypothetical protein